MGEMSTTDNAVVAGSSVSLSEISFAILESRDITEAIRNSLDLLRKSYADVPVSLLEIGKGKTLLPSEMFDSEDFFRSGFELILSDQSLNSLISGKDVIIHDSDINESDDLSGSGLASLNLFPVLITNDMMLILGAGSSEPLGLNRERAGFFAKAAGWFSRLLKSEEEKGNLGQLVKHYSEVEKYSGVGSWSWNIRTGEIFWSDSVEPLFGFKRGEFKRTYEAFLNCIHPDDRQTVTAAVNDAVNNGSDYQVEHRVVWPDGTVRWMIEKGDVERDEDGTSLFMYGMVQDITARKKTETELENSNKLLASVAETSPDHIITLDLDFKITFLNFASPGLTVDDITGTSILNYLPEDQKEYVKSVLMRIVETGKPERYETRFDIKDGGEVYYETSASPRFDGERVTGLTLNSRDITDRKKSELVRVHHSLLVENVSDAVMGIGLDFTIKSWNKSAERIYGFTEDEVIGKSTKDVLNSRFGDNLSREDVLEILIKNGAWQGEVVQVTKSGNDIVSNFSLSLIKDDDGNPVEVVAAGKDVTELVKRRKEIEQQKVIFESVIMTVSDVVIITNLNREIIEVNGAITKVFGYEPHEVFGKKTAVLYASENDFHKKGSERYNSNASVATGDDHIYETLYKRKNGEVFVGETMGSPYKNKEGEVMGFLGVIRDITKRKMNQNALNSRITELKSLYRLDRLTEESDDLNEIFTSFITEIVPSSMLVSDNVIAEMVIDGQSYEHGIIKHNNLLEATINAGGNTRGHLRIGFKDEDYVFDEYEQNLTKAFGERIGNILERMEIRNELEDSRKQLSERVKERTRDLTSINKRLLVEIGERKKVEDRLRLTEFSVDNSAVSTFWTNDHGQFIHVNNAACDLVGIPRERLLSLSMHDVFRSKEVEEWSCFWKKLKEERHYLSDEMSIANGSGNLPVETSFNYLEYNNKDYCFLFARDISSRKMVEAQVQYHLHLEETVSKISKRFLGVERVNLEEILRFIGKVLNVERASIIQNDEKNREIFISHKWYSDPAYPVSEKYMRQRIDSLPDMKNRIFEQKQSVFVSEISEMPPEAEAEKSLMTDMGVKSFCSVPIVLKNGKVWGVLQVENMKDQRDWIDFEVRFLQVICGMVSSHIEQQKSETERLDLEQQLFHAQKMESIGRLAGGIAHDFNNILTGILGYSELLESIFDEVDTPEGEATMYIADGVRRASRLTGQLLAFARKGAFRIAPENLNDIIRKTLKVSEKIFEKKINVNLKFEDDLRNAEVDSNQVEQVLTNILINAKDALPEGGTITIETANVVLDKRDKKRFVDLKTGKYVQMVFADDGIGMSKDVLDKIFEPFFTTKEEGKGTGLGMSMAYGIIKKHGGYIDVESTPGVGTAFYIYFPATEKRLVETGEDVNTHVGDATILLIDDELTVRKVVSSLLKRSGYNVYVASSGKEGLDKYRRMQDEIDIVLLDIIMPGLDGKETFSELKKINPDVKTLFMSGFSADNTLSELIREGALGFLEKPVRFNELTMLISSIMDTERRNKPVVNSENGNGSVKKKPIMIIDDEQINIQQLSEFLQVLGYGVISSTNAKDGFNIAVENPCSIVIMDINMPGTNGYELLEMFRKHYKDSDQEKPEFVVVSGQNPDEIQERCIEAGARYVIGKPVDLNRLVSIIEEVVSL